MKGAIWNTCTFIVLGLWIATDDTWVAVPVVLLTACAIAGVWGDFASRRLIDAQREQIDLLKHDVLALGGEKWWT